MAKAVSVKFNNQPYEKSHGKAPRGYGYWAFAFGVGDSGAAFAPPGQFWQAKVWATREARHRAAEKNHPGPVYIDVLP